MIISMLINILFRLIFFLIHLFQRYLLTNSSSDIQNNGTMNSLDEVINAMGLLNFTDKVLIKQIFFFRSIRFLFYSGTTFHVSYIIWYINNW